MVAAARALSLPVFAVDIPPPVDARAELAPLTYEMPPPSVPLVLHINAPVLPLALLRLPRSLIRGRMIVGYWAWELPQASPDWRHGARFVHEIWTPSRFSAKALEPLLPGRVRVVPPAMAVVPPVPAALDRGAFGLPDDAVIVLVSFNLASSYVRKNPLAAIAAFRAAFGERPDRILVMKVGHPDHAPADFAALAAAAQAPNIRLETRLLPTADHYALMAVSDIVLSLHRSEGFGLVPAEAMLLGRPVIATGWSGNTDFMDQSNSALVGYRLVPVMDPRQVYQGGLWADPDVADAVGQLRRLADDVEVRCRLGHRARESVRSYLGTGPLTAALRAIGVNVRDAGEVCLEDSLAGRA
jgi:glycosyltransferase involved in cell wall biosynthesis